MSILPAIYSILDPFSLPALMANTQLPRTHLTLHPPSRRWDTHALTRQHTDQKTGRNLEKDKIQGTQRKVWILAQGFGLGQKLPQRLE